MLRPPTPERPLTEDPATTRTSSAPPRELPTLVDALVVGGGPAGLSAATWLGRYRRRTLVVDAGLHRNRHVEQVHGLLGRDPISPAELLRDAVEGLAAYPHVTRHEGRVHGITGTEGGFVADVDGVEVTASRIVLCTGVRDQLPEVAGIDVHYGADVQHCPTCEGFEARDRRVVVLGWGAHVPAFATELLDWARSVVVLSDGSGPTQVTDEQRRKLATVGIEVLDDRAEELLGPRGGLRAVRLASGEELPAELAFFSIGHEATTGLARSLGCEVTEEGVLAVDEDQRTSVEGVFAAGDVTPGMQLVPVAMGEGTIAGVACAQSLQGQQTAPDAPPAAPAPGPMAP